MDNLTRVAVLSDTHGLFRPEVTAYLQNCDLIIHAGDVGPWHIITELKEFAPVISVRGNCDCGETARHLTLKKYFKLNKHNVLLTHDISRLNLSEEQKKVQIVIHGHTHSFENVQRNNITCLNPGSIGPERYGKRVTMMLLDFGKELEVTEIRF